MSIPPGRYPLPDLPPSVALPTRRERLQTLLHQSNRLYQGVRIRAGETTVTVNGVPLPHHPRHSPDGFEWGYEGSGPADLAYALLLDAVTGAGSIAVCTDLAQRNHQRFKRAVVGGLAAQWTLTRRFILGWLLEHGRLDDDD